MNIINAIQLMMKNAILMNQYNKKYESNITDILTQLFSSMVFISFNSKSQTQSLYSD